MSLPVPALADRARDCARAIQAAETVLVAAHIDADGLTSAGIAATALERVGVPHEVAFATQLDPDEIAALAATDHDTVLFTDFGSGQLETIDDHATDGDFTPVVVDHHQPADVDIAHHLNPLLEGINGATELSGAGATYLLARALGADRVEMRDLAALAVVGAVGDRQADDGELLGANAAIAEEGAAVDAVEPVTDLAMYGTQTRPLPKLLEYADDVSIPGVTGSANGATEFLEDLDVAVRDGEDWRTWADLRHEERRTVVSALLRRGVERGVPPDRIDALVGTSYVLTAEEPGTVLRDASEFGTLLNATARYDRADVGLAVCLGDRGGAFNEARRLLRTHRQNLSTGLDWVVEHGVTREDHVQWFHAEDQIKATIVGIVAGMAVGADGIPGDVPIVAFATKPDDPDAVKVSARGTPRLVGQGLDLSVVMHEAATAVGGDGGGHDVAAGATVPRGSEPDFIERVDAIVGDQLSSKEN
ncbi:MAG: DHHA1 domain-containing protein [Halobacteriaceae archaeon]